MQKFGIAVKSLGPNQLNYHMCLNINRLMKERYDLCPMIFFEDPEHSPTTLMCPMMQISEAHCFDGPIITTSLSTSEKIAAMSGTGSRYFYVWDLEWIRPGHVPNYDYMQPIYSHPRLQLIGRNADHCDIIENCFNRRPEQIMENFNFTTLLALIDDELRNVPKKQASIS